MKKLILSSLFVALSIIGYSQPPQPQAKEYSSIFMRVQYQGNRIIYRKKGESKSPVYTSPDGRMAVLYDHEGGKSLLSDLNGEFINEAHIINYMAKLGWTVKNSTILPYEGDGGNTSTSIISNDNEYMHLIIFERPYIPPTN